MSSLPKSADEDYANQYSEAFVARWDDLIDWEKRARGEGGFFEERLHAAGARRVLDVSTGSGFHAVQLCKAGFEVTAVDGSRTMVERARRNFADRQLAIDLYHTDWLDLDAQWLGTFDAIVCLGSSLCHVFDASTRVRVLQRFRQLLRPGGLLMVDQRNFAAILAGHYKASGNYYYCGSNARVGLGEVTPDVCEFTYCFDQAQEYRLRVFPLTPEQLQSEIGLAGFHWERAYGDFKQHYAPLEADFVVHQAHAI